MDDLLDQVRDLVEGQVDFEGQRLVELLSTALLATAGVIAFIVGFITQNIHLTLWVGLAGSVLTFLAVVPPWPVFNRKPLNWLPAMKGGVSAGGAQFGSMPIVVDGVKVG